MLNNATVCTIFLLIPIALATIQLIPDTCTCFVSSLSKPSGRFIRYKIYY